MNKKCVQPVAIKINRKKAIEVGNIFKIKTKFTEAFKFYYQTAEGKEKIVTMGCFGMGPSRIMGTLVEIFHDDKGIIWPESVAPYKINLVALGVDEEVLAEADKIYDQLTQAGSEVLFDDRTEKGAGEKLGDADLIGLPYRVIISKKTLAEKSAEVKRRDSQEAELVLFKSLLAKLK